MKKEFNPHFRTPFLRERKFTMIELLIVIAVIAILITLLLPALNKARKTAQSIGCTSNLQQIGKGSYMYSSDNTDYILPFWTKHYGHKPETFFYQLLNQCGVRWYGNYVNKGAFRCPGERRPIGSSNFSDAAGQMYLASHYGVNAYLHPGFSEKGTGGKIKKTSAVYAPSRAISIGDRQRTTTKHFNSIGWIGYRHGPGEDSRINISSLAGVLPGSRANLLYYDGHVSSRAVFELQQTPKDPRYNLLGNSGSAVNGAGYYALGAGFDNLAGSQVPGSN